MSPITRVQRWLKEKKIDALLIEDPTNLYYLTGQELSTGIFLATPKSARLIVDSRYYESCKAKAPLPVSLTEPKVLEKLLSSRGWQQVQTLAFDSLKSSYDRALQLRKLLSKLPGKRKLLLTPSKGPIGQLRKIKSNEELELLRRAARLGSRGFDFLCEQLRSGVTELELAAALDSFWKSEGAYGHSFDPIIAFGPNGSMPHYKPRREVKLRRGDPVLMDIGVSLDHYCSDMTRVVSFGKPPKKIQEIYAIVLEAQEAALALCRSGARMDQVDQAAREVIASYGYAKEFCHNLGHGIGLDVHEEPFFRPKEKTLLEPGMVITIEPGIYLPGIGGVRIEDTIVITDGGHENLTNRPKELTSFRTSRQESPLRGG